MLPQGNATFAGFVVARQRKHRFPTLYTPYTAMTTPKQKPAAFLPRGKLANNSLQQWNIGKVGI